MKKLKSIFTVLALVALCGCSNDQLVGDNALITGSDASGSISFGAGSSAITRANLYGSSAATKLSDRFVVYGIKHVEAEDKTATNDAVVFNNFQVKWTANSAGQAASNSSNWEYVGLQAYDVAPSQQGVKYWDHSAVNGHTFYAFSSTDISYPKNEASDKILVSKVTTDANSLYNKGYAVTIKDGANLSNLYFSDRVPVDKADYEKTVSFTFRNLGTLLRIGFYETIPGYTVKIDRFYIDADASAAVTSFAAMKDQKTDGFYASLENVKRTSGQTLNVTYHDVGSDVNRPVVANPSAGFNYTLNMGNAAGIINKVLSTSSATPTWVDGSATGTYTPIYPFEANQSPLLLKLDFTMTAEDGSPDVIHVRGARCIVPAEYVQWKSNFAYTYLFKISDKSNGTTGAVDENGDPTDPEGLKPITFDAITVDVTEERQESVTSVSDNSITTYAEGAIANEYKAGKAVYAVIVNKATHDVITPSGIGNTAGKADVYQLDEAATESEVLGQLTGLPMGLTLTSVTPTVETAVPLSDGSTSVVANVKFTPATAGTYAYVYTTTAYVAPTYEVQTAGTYDSGKTYYMLSGSGAYYAVSVPTAAAFDANKSQLYLQTDAGTPGVYDVKVIKVQ